jgi:superfamily II DNA or RNA helicase
VKEERISVLDDFQAGRVRVIVVTKILDRGTNRLGHTDDLIFASGEGSTTQTLQRIGRGLRRGGGKEFLRLVDIVDRVRTEGADTKWQVAAVLLECSRT